LTQLFSNMQLFYAPDITGELYTFNEEESKHIVRVLRLKENDTIYLTDGKGWFYQVQIADAHPKACTVRVNQKELQTKHSYYLHIAIAPTKNIERFEWFLEKATELGIDEITPLLTANSERDTIKFERLQKVIESAMKQSYKAYHPKLNPMTKWSDFVKKTYSFERLLIAHCYAGAKIHLKNQLLPQENALILIGPEGDFSLQEVETALKKGFEATSLGEYRLRTETAGIAAVGMVSWINVQNN